MLINKPIFFLVIFIVIKLNQCNFVHKLPQYKSKVWIVSPPESKINKSALGSLLVCRMAWGCRSTIFYPKFWKLRSSKKCTFFPGCRLYAKAHIWHKAWPKMTHSQPMQGCQAHGFLTQLDFLKEVGGKLWCPGVGVFLVHFVSGGQCYWACYIKCYIKKLVTYCYLTCQLR